MVGPQVLSTYGLLGKEQQGQLQAIITQKIGGLIGVHGDIAVLVEYIHVMLQSEKNGELIEQELEAFLQEKSKPFVAWLGKQLEEVAAASAKSKAEAAPSERPAAGSDIPGDQPDIGEKTGSASTRHKAREHKKSGATGSLRSSKRDATGSRRSGGVLGNLLGKAMHDAQRSSTTGGELAESGPSTKKSKEAKRPRIAQDSAAHQVLMRASADTSRSQMRSARLVSKSTRTAEMAASTLSTAADANTRGRSRSRSRKAQKRLAAVIKRVAHQNSGRASRGTKSGPARWQAQPSEDDGSSEAEEEEEDSEGAAAQGVGQTSSRNKPAAVLSEAQEFRGRSSVAAAAVAAAAHSTRAGSPPRRGGSPQAFCPPPARPRRPKSSRSALSAAANPPVAGAHDPGAARNCWRQESSPPPRRGAAVLAPAKSEADSAAASRWHFQAAPQDLFVPPTWAPASTVLTPAPAPVSHAAGFTAPAVAVQPAPPRPVSTRPRPKGFVPQKWRVACEALAVSQTEFLDSAEVRVLKQGEIVESVGPAFSLPNGVVRVAIAHPSSAAYPNPIGWVSQDETAVGGTRNIEPGPQPLQASQRNSLRPSGPYGGGWRPRPAYRPPYSGGTSYRPRAFTNMTWRPTST